MPLQATEKAISELLADIKGGQTLEKFTPYQRVKVTDALDAMPERLHRLKECVRLMSFSKADHSDVMK